MSNLIISNNSLAKQYLGILRDTRTSISRFRFALENLSKILLAEALKDLDLKSYEVDTPLETTSAYELLKPVVVVPILRAGLSMLNPFLDFLPDAQIGFIGQKRDEETAQAFEYYKNFPELKNKTLIITDPMLATGGSAVATIEALIEKDANINDIKLVCVISAPEGIEKVHSKYPTIPIITSSLDSHLNEQKFIVPGLGDAGDLWAGTNGN
ncbi:MAG: uracil phosphoribosyltransferase [Candidatus Caenarcaniphilales bacterium]|nr:uracil phosphoribosyltransferase [Candidatus Caenarcaniphilales bacterium]